MAIFYLQSVMAIQFEHFGVTDTDIGGISFVAVLCQVYDNFLFAVQQMGQRITAKYFFVS